MWCKLFGHKWYYYKEFLKYNVPDNFSGLRSLKTIEISIETEFRYCQRCDTNQIQRLGHPGYIIDSWRDYGLNKEQLRQKKLKQLGI